jgi:hypothetical protein
MFQGQSDCSSGARDCPFIIQQLCAAKKKPDMGDCHFNVRLAMTRVEGHVIFISAVRGRIFA